MGLLLKNKPRSPIIRGFGEDIYTPWHFTVQQHQRVLVYYKKILIQFLRQLLHFTFNYRNSHLRIIFVCIAICANSLRVLDRNDLIIIVVLTKKHNGIS